LIGYITPPANPVYFDPDQQHEYDVIAKALSGHGAIIDRTPDGKRILVQSQSGNGPISYWLLDRTKGKPELKLALDTYRGIPDDEVNPVKEVSYAARDGLTIPAFVTLPRNAVPGPLPFVVLPHGGPWAADNPFLGFDWMAQFLASQGYGVLQPQFRGSTGRGAAFEQAGFRQWGLAMQDDVTDGTHWLIDQKMADPARIAIVGMSYGGYAALEGVIREPALYRCAVAWAPVTDLSAEAHKLSQIFLASGFIERLQSDDDARAAASPDRHADKIAVPVLLAHGKNDFNVSVTATERMESALKSAGKPVETLYFPKADHYMTNEADRLLFLQTAKKFLAANLGEMTASRGESTATQ
jgi:dipeptidyl aminopeptidase/acylaminoacyl peptidase